MDLKEIQKDALTNRGSLDYLFQSHYYQWLAVIKLILDDYYSERRR
jgi:hypothetical protein